MEKTTSSMVSSDAIHDVLRTIPVPDEQEVKAIAELAFSMNRESLQVINELPEDDRRKFMQVWAMIVHSVSFGLKLMAITQKAGLGPIKR